MTENKRTSLIKPTLETRYHIDFDWWSTHERDWRVYLRSYLCSEHQEVYQDIENDIRIDWVAAKTGEVTQVDGLQHTLIAHCARQEGFIVEQGALVDSVFRVFLANGNTPQTAEELGERLNRPPLTILKTLSGMRVYKGIRPTQD
jgi:hypothetical protein